jgi:hypothetical protein
VYGGRRRFDSERPLSGDVWLFDVSRSAWRGPLQMAVPRGAVAPMLPAPRVFSALAALEVSGGVDWAAVAVLTMGSVTTPVMSCNTEAWFMMVRTLLSPPPCCPARPRPVLSFASSRSSPFLSIALPMTTRRRQFSEPATRPARFGPPSRELVFEVSRILSFPLGALECLRLDVRNRMENPVEIAKYDPRQKGAPVVFRVSIGQRQGWTLKLILLS